MMELDITQRFDPIPISQLLNNFVEINDIFFQKRHVVALMYEFIGGNLPSVVVFQKPPVDNTEVFRGFEDDFLVLDGDLGGVKIILGGLIEGDGEEDGDQRFVTTNTAADLLHRFTMSINSFFLREKPEIRTEYEKKRDFFPFIA